VSAPAPAPGESVKRLLPWLVAVAFFMESLDTTILNTAVPAVSAALHVSPLSMKAVLASYTLSLAVFIPISGWMADRFGTRRVFSSAIGIFTLGSFLCGISSNIHLLVACRILQGCGGAMMVPVGRLTMVRTFAKSELVRAMSFVAIPGLIGPMLGPVVGGFIVGYFHWRLIFFINLPIGLLGLYLVYRHLPDYREATSRPLDVIGLHRSNAPAAPKWRPPRVADCPLEAAIHGPDARHSKAYARVILQNGSDMSNQRLVECPICPKILASSSCRSGRRSIGTSKTSSCRPSRTLVYKRYGPTVFFCLQRSCPIYGGS